MTAHRVAVLPRHRGEILVQRRDSPDGSEPRLAAITAAADGDPAADRNPAAVARQRLHAATGIPEEAMTVVRVGESVERVGDERTDDEQTDGSADPPVPVLVDVAQRGDTAAPDWEWVAPPALRPRATLPWLVAAYDVVRPSVATVADDTSHGSTTLSVRALEILRDEAALASATSEGEREGRREEQGTADPDHVRDVARELLAARPAMTAVRNRVNRAVTAAENDAGAFGAAVADAAHEGIERAVAADGRAAANAAERLAGGRIATLSRSGTVLATLESAAPTAVLVAASHPGGEGIGVAEALAGGDDRAGAPATDVTLTTDAAFPSELVRWGADALLVGADTVLPDGSVRNKVGTYPAAAVAAREGVPVFVVTATDKISPDAAVEREPWPGESPYDGDAPLAVTNPTFDVTPAECIDAIVTELGALDAGDVAAVAAEHRALAAWDDACEGHRQRERPPPGRFSEK